MGLLNLLVNDPLTFLFWRYRFSIPSSSMNWPTAGWLIAWGIRRPNTLGRLTLNPLKHLDPIGTAMLFIFGFGWAKPVPVNFNRLGHTRLGLILVSSAGIVANMIFAFLAVLLLRLLSPSPSGSIGQLLYYLAQINIMLASFNLIPIPPLDGSKILMGFLPERLQYALSRLEPLRILHHHRSSVPGGAGPGHPFLPLDHPCPDRPAACLSMKKKSLTRRCLPLTLATIPAKR